MKHPFIINKLSELIKISSVRKNNDYRVIPRRPLTDPILYNREIDMSAFIKNK